MTDAKYGILSNKSYVRHIHPSILGIPNSATRVASYELKHIYDDNLWVFHKVRGVNQAFIQKTVTAVGDQYNISMEKRNTGQFSGNIRQKFLYLFTTYRIFHQASSAISKISDWNALCSRSLLWTTFSIKLETLTNAETWKTVPILTLNLFWRHTILSTRMEIFANP